MGSPEAVIRATVNRLGARIGHGIADAAAELAVLAQDAPDRIRQEWELFQEEVRAEAERLEQRPNDAQSNVSEPGAVDAPEVQPPAASTDSPAAASNRETPQELIDRLRASVSDLSKQIEVRS